MSWNTEFSASINLDHSADKIANVILDAERLPTWNPAFTHVGPQRNDGKYPLVVQRILRGTLEYSRIGKEITCHIMIPGLTEESTFTLTSNGTGTTVTHTVRQRGRLSAIIGTHEASLVPNKRLTRLAHLLNSTRQ
ncbi:hypothetical protein GSS88_02145 [Corynebacterium sp. 3HC-13]|uniref:hypothetical protein n=1 Tax=Corynebacterium poyangense TaxID=2684405 RepID=UPI001CCA4DC5|nr:hypothetical protein [Corynebacterium poyangense]MBZ8176600.1 hypothetical protein [Corynebacterium poyangense]